MNESATPHQIESLFREALINRAFSGASLLVATSERIVFEKSWGHTKRGGEPIEHDTMFDLASLTKSLVTAALCIRAVSQGVLSLDDRLDRFFLSSCLPAGKKVITVRQLLCHSSGLVPYQPFFQQLISVPVPARADTLLRWIFQTYLLAPPGKSCSYSDLGFILLGRILEEVYQQHLDCLSEIELFSPLGINSLIFSRLEVPPDPSTVPTRLGNDSFLYAATELCPWRRRLLVGEVHDENAYCLGGVSGHSGLFGTARGVSLLLAFLWQVYIGSVRHNGWSSDVLQSFWTRQDKAAGNTWALGFDTPSPGKSCAGDVFSPTSIGHLGFTGTSFWIDLAQNVLVILLTNRVYPTRDNDKLQQFRPLLHNLIMKELPCFLRS